MLFLSLFLAAGRASLSSERLAMRDRELPGEGVRKDRLAESSQDCKCIPLPSPHRADEGKILHGAQRSLPHAFISPSL